MAVKLSLDLAQIIARISNMACKGAGRDGGWAGQIHFAFLAAHAAREIPVGCANTLHAAFVHPAKCVDRSTKAC